MACFPGSSTPSETNSQTGNANPWATKHDLEQRSYQVSNIGGDKATFVFTGTVFQGRADLGINTLFELDQEGSQGGGTSCQLASSQDAVLYDSPTTALGLHTLLITSHGSPHTSTGSTILAPAPQITAFPPFASILSMFLPPISSSTSPVAGPSLPIVQSSSFPELPPEISLSRTASGSSATNQPTGGGSPSRSYTTSSYTEATVVGGRTTTIVIQTTVEVPQTQTTHGLSRGAVAGVAVGSLLFLFLLVGGVSLWWYRRRIRPRFLKDSRDLDPEPNTATGPTTYTTATKTVHRSKPLATPVSDPVAAGRSPEVLYAGPEDAPLCRSESEEDRRKRSALIAPPSPSSSKSVPEPSPALHDDPSTSPSDAPADAALARPQAVMTGTDSKPDSESTPVDFRLLPSPPPRGPERSARDIATVTGGECNVPTVGARRLWVEADSGVRLAGGRLGETRGDEVESGEWEVLPPPYQEF